MNSSIIIEALASIDTVPRKRKRSSDGWLLLTGAASNRVQGCSTDTLMLQIRIPNPSTGVDLMRSGPDVSHVSVTFSCPACNGCKHTLPPRSKWLRTDVVHQILRTARPSMPRQLDCMRSCVNTYKSAVGWCVRVRHADCL